MRVIHYWASGMPRSEATSYLRDICGSDSADFSEVEREVTCERCLAVLRAGQGTPKEAEAGTTSPLAGLLPQADPSAHLKRKEFERELARLINRLSLEHHFGNRPDFELARIAWEHLSKC